MAKHPNARPAVGMEAVHSHCLARARAAGGGGGAAAGGGGLGGGASTNGAAAATGSSPSHRSPPHGHATTAAAAAAATVPSTSTALTTSTSLPVLRTPNVSSGVRRVARGSVRAAARQGVSVGELKQARTGMLAAAPPLEEDGASLLHQPRPPPLPLIPPGALYIGDGDYYGDAEAAAVQDLIYKQV